MLGWLLRRKEVDSAINSLTRAIRISHTEKEKAEKVVEQANQRLKGNINGAH